LQTLLWAATGQEAFARRAMRIMDEYGRRLVRYAGKNAKLQAGEAASGRLERCNSNVAPHMHRSMERQQMGPRG